MHVVFISKCAGKAIARTRRTLDGYAQRSGDSTWMTPITTEGLAEVRALLRRGASRNTAVACFRNDGYRRMRLLFTVGRAGAFDARGASPIAVHRSTRKSSPPTWSKVACLLAAAAGYGHDLGKFGAAFQDKLRQKTPTADPVRHEWISLALLRRMLDHGDTAVQAWSALFDDASDVSSIWVNKAPFDQPIKDAKTALLFEVATHHRLPAANTVKLHVRDPAHRPARVAAPSSQVETALASAIRRLQAAAPADAGPLYWRAVSTVTRMALVLADHYVSAAKRLDLEAGAYANTDRATGRLNQSLDWHLLEVGDQAAHMVTHLISLRPPCVDEADVARLLKPSPSGPYAWQNRAASALQASIRQRDVPHLILNLAATGSGKTRMNARLAATARPAHAVRFATSLNLRTLTLQTADAYRDQLGIAPDSLACVIGDRLTAALHEHQKSLARRPAQKPDAIDGAGAMAWDDDENQRGAEFEVLSSFIYDDAPPWLDHFFHRNAASLRSVIGAPILVSTVDYLVAAGELPRQASHALAALRVMTSDLILDEIDGYDAKALIAVLRIVTLASMAGRHVIASSATLSRPVADMLFRAFRLGACLRRALDEPSGTQPAPFRVSLIDDSQSPVVFDAGSPADFAERYDLYLASLLSGLVGTRLRVPFLQPVDVSDGAAGFFSAVQSAASALHACHHQVDPVTGRRYSVGLVRMANVQPAVLVASHLARNLGGARVCCYHANLLAMHRFHVERSLDAMLCRKPGALALHDHPGVREALHEATTDDVLLVVVATPVEEIGRDHDFDWAVIEPSSSQSIVQTSGRVNRHRKGTIERPNVALLQVNFKEATSAGARRLVFVRPGLESDGTHPSHDLSALLDWSRLDAIDARLRFAGHPFADCDDAALIKQTQGWMKQLFSDTADGARNGFFWVYQNPYNETPLRARSPVEVEVLVSLGDDQSSSYSLTLNDSGEAVGRRVIEVARHPADWLVIDDPGLAHLARHAHVDLGEGLRVRLQGFREDDVARIRRHLSFGFYFDKQP